MGRETEGFVSEAAAHNGIETEITKIDKIKRVKTLRFLVFIFLINLSYSLPHILMNIKINFYKPHVYADKNFNQLVASASNHKISKFNLRTVVLNITKKCRVTMFLFTVILQ